MKLNIYLESLIAKKHDQYSICELYKNPSTLKNFKPEIRGIILKNGDLYLMEYEVIKRKRNYNYVIHADIAQVLRENKIIPQKADYRENGDPENYSKWFITVYRKRATNTFYLAESYPYDFNNYANFLLESYKKKFEKKFPQYILDI